ncbi:hypothetical protein G7046_g2636 [Stylonectria norvegica]|nr:hypothetical protein G7046_g2636 [Stylonectria norvegica]
MDSSPTYQQSQDIAAQNQAQGANPTLTVDFSWKKFKAFIAEANNPKEPLYAVDFMTIKSSMIVKSTANGETVGTGTIHPISINAKYELRGQKGQLKALKHFHTSYTHLSDNFSDSDAPVAMTWASSCGFKTWDFICLDDQQNPVAKFSSNSWALKKMGSIEFMGPKATSAAAREEIVVVGLTLFYCMLLRTTNFFSLFGAIFSNPGPIKTEAAENSRLGMAKNIDDDQSSLSSYDHSVTQNDNKLVT